MPQYDIHYRQGERDWRYAGQSDGANAKAAIKAFKKSTHDLYSSYKLRAKRANPAPAAVKGRKVKNGRAVVLKNFSGTVVRTREGRVVIQGTRTK